MITTVICLRAPGMTMWRMPIFTWAIFVTSILVLIAFPILTAALFGLLADRHFGAHVFDPANGGAILFQHLFCRSSPSRGLHHRLALLRDHLRGDPGVQPQADLRLPRHGVRAARAIAALSVAVWAHHMSDRSRPTSIF